MKVSILAVTPCAEAVVATAAHQCVSADDASDFLIHVDQSRVESIIQKALGMGHDSILEHANFTIALSGISRSLSHQLVRFRIASFAQQSQRYLKFKGGAFEFITPPSILNADPRTLLRYQLLMAQIGEFYEDALNEGIPAEDARFPVPNAAATAIVVTMNARELNHAFSLRCCTHAQWEIREMFWEILNQVKRLTPLLFIGAGPSCCKGPCPEGPRNCGRAGLAN